MKFVPGYPPLRILHSVSFALGLENADFTSAETLLAVTLHILPLRYSSAIFLSSGFLLTFAGDTAQQYNSPVVPRLRVWEFTPVEPTQTGTSYMHE